jgi:hypothetical protein
MAFLVAIPIAISGLSGLGYYFYSSSSSETKETAPSIEVGKKYSEVMNELPNHPIFQKSEMKAPSLEEIKSKKAGLRHVELNVKNEVSIMEKFVLSLQQRKETLAKVN